MSTGDVYRALWRHKFFILVLTWILIAGSWYFTSRQTPVYEASTLVRIEQRITNAAEAYDSLILGERLAQTYAEIVGTARLDRAVGRALGDPPEGGTPSVSLSAEPVETLELLRIHARSPSPERAMLAANAVPTALRDFIAESALREEIVTVERAELPREPVSPNLTLNIAIALLLGLMFNGALALLIEILGDRLPESDEVEAALGTPVLGAIPSLTFAKPGHAGSSAQHLSIDGHPPDAPDERVQKLRGSAPT